VRDEKKVRWIDIERHIRDNGERDDNCRKKTPDERQRQRGDDVRPKSDGDEMKMLREWGSGWVENLGRECEMTEDLAAESLILVLIFCLYERKA